MERSKAGGALLGGEEIDGLKCDMHPLLSSQKLDLASARAEWMAVEFHAP
jgi:hypothetical protein